MSERCLFITPLDHIELSARPFGKGLQFSDRYYLHNDYGAVAQFFTDKILVGLGQQEHDLIKSCSAFLYEVRNCEGINVSRKAFEARSEDMLGEHLADVHDFCSKTWFLGDISVLPGGSLAIARSSIRRATLHELYTSTRGAKSNRLSLEDLRTIRPFLQGSGRKILADASKDSPFSKAGTRLGRAFTFIGAARHVSQIPLKIVFYCSALECLFSTQSSELSHQVAERVSWFCAEEPEARLHTYKLVKQAYSLRSKIVHGSTLTDAVQSNSAGLAEQIDELIRSILTKVVLHDDKVFRLKNDLLDEYFLKLILENGREPFERSD